MLNTGLSLNNRQVKYIEQIMSEKAKLFINWAELSRTLAGDRSAITKARIPKKHKETIEKLIKSIGEWLFVAENN